MRYREYGVFFLYGTLGILFDYLQRHFRKCEREKGE